MKHNGWINLSIDKMNQRVQDDKKMVKYKQKLQKIGIYKKSSRFGLNFIRVIKQQKSGAQMIKNQLFSVFFSILFLVSSVTAQDKAPETFQFTTEVTRLMDILINSLYTQKQIFLREVISNASDALDKIRFVSLTDPDALGDTKDLQIRIQINQEQKYVEVRDTGVGMTKQQLIENLGTIAKSGTTNFLEALKAGNINLIGQFGVGFYSTFLAGSKVVVVTKSNNDDTQWIWTSDAASYQIKPDTEGNTLGRGTIVRIYLKEDAQQFLSHKKIFKLVKKYSEFIDFPILLNNKKQIQVEEPVETETTEDQEDLQIKQTDQDKQKKTQKVKKTVYEWEQINTEKALWLRNKDDIYEEDYIDFYKSLSKQSNPPMNWIHFNTDGEVVFNSILYIPNRAPHDFYQNYHGRNNDLKLYVRRVLITEKNNDLIPKYLSFVMGVIDSDDLPLNVNRQTLVQSKTFKIINQKITKKILDMVQEIAKWDEVDEQEYEEDFEYEFEEEQLEKFTEQELKQKKEQAREKYLNRNKQRYEKFYKEFGKAIKLGILEDKNNREKLASLSRWHSTRSKTDMISFDDYIAKMKPVQDQIYFFSGEDRSVLEKSPLVVGLVRRGYEVILCDDPIDEYVFNTLREYEKKNIVNVGKGDFKMPDDDELERKKQKFLSKKYEPLVNYFKKILFEKVNNVIISNRLTDQPCVVVADSYGHSSFMDKIQKAQMFAGAQDNPVSDFKKIMEINPHHKVNQIILQKINNNQSDEELEQLVELMYETAAFHSGFSPKDNNDFVKRFYKTYSKALGVINLQRHEIPVEGDVELDEKDYEGENQEILRLNPSDIKISTPDDEDIV